MRTFAGSSEEKNEPPTTRIPPQSSTTNKKAVQLPELAIPEEGDKLIVETEAPDQ